MNFQEFYAGDSFSAHSFLGAHPLQEGFVFRVYAPAALKMALIGEFSDWQEIPMERIYDCQFYEVSVPSAKEKQMYKFRVCKKDGKYIDRADPYAFFSEKRPGTASVLYDLNYEFAVFH